MLIEEDPVASDPLREAWYIVHCQPAKERTAASLLKESLELQVYVPEVIQYRNGVTHQTPFFPCYIFVRADLGETGLSGINTTPGVLRLLATAGTPQPVPCEVIEGIRERLDALNSRGGLLAQQFHPGDRVTIRKGPFRGLDAIFVEALPARARVKVLLELLGRENEVKLEPDALERSSGDRADPSQRTRGTRGKGRRIAAWPAGQSLL